MLRCAAGEEVLDAAEAEAPLAGRARRDPAADGAQLPRLRLVTEGEATPGERRLEGRSGGAGADRGQAAPPVEIAQAGEPGQVHGEHGAVADSRRHAADDARPAAERDHRGARLGRIGEEVADLGTVLRASDPVRHCRHAP